MDVIDVCLGSVVNDVAVILKDDIELLSRVDVVEQDNEDVGYDTDVRVVVMKLRMLLADVSALTLRSFFLKM